MPFFEGSASGAFEFIKHSMKFVPYESCQPYTACSSDSKEMLCQHVNTECTPMNICRTCANPMKGGTCNQVGYELLLISREILYQIQFVHASLFALIRPEL